jgi:hypothetical protein
MLRRAAADLSLDSAASQRRAVRVSACESARSKRHLPATYRGQASPIQGAASSCRSRSDLSSLARWREIPVLQMTTSAPVRTVAQRRATTTLHAASIQHQPRFSRNPSHSRPAPRRFRQLRGSRQPPSRCSSSPPDKQNFFHRSAYAQIPPRQRLAAVDLALHMFLVCQANPAPVSHSHFVGNPGPTDAYRAPLRFSLSTHVQRSG